MTDEPFVVTFFDHHSARFKSESQLTVAELVDMLESEHAERKDLLRWLKLARFGQLTTDKGSLRHDRNVVAVSGCEADYDGGEMAIDTAVAKLKAAGVRAIVYTSPSHTMAKPRFRVLCPFSQLLPPSERSSMVARLNGVLGGVIAPESFTLSQSYYFGFLADGAGEPLDEHRVVVVEGTPIDQHNELSHQAIGKNKKTVPGNGHSEFEFTETEELFTRILSGEALHTSVTSLAGRYARDGLPIAFATATIRAVFLAAHQDRYRGRWEECVEAIRWVYEREAQRSSPIGEEAPPEAKLTAHTFTELKDKIFMALNWIVPQWIPEGVTLFAGKPKLGKSWLMLATTLANATAEVVLDQMCQQREVLYCALEDTERRMKARTEVILSSDGPWPANAFIAYAIPTIDRGGIDVLERWIADHPTVGLIIIDTLAGFRGPKRQNETQFDADYRCMNALANLARKTKVAFVVVHHVRKQTAEDVFDTISGTMGLSAAADTLLILTKGSDTLRLTVRGRDVEPEDKTVAFDPDSGAWTVTGDYEGDQAMSGTKELILAVLTQHTSGATAEDIAKTTTLKLNTVQQALRRMAKAGRIQKTQYGTYALR